MDAIYRVSPYDPDALFAALKATEPYDAISGALAIDADGDRVGSLALHNVQIDEDRSITPTLASSRLVTRAIGVVSAEGEVSFKGARSLQWRLACQALRGWVATIAPSARQVDSRQRWATRRAICAPLGCAPA